MCPEIMSLDTRVNSAIEATSTSSASTEASVVSPCANHDDHCSTSTTDSSPQSLMHFLLRKRLVSTLLRNVKETSMVEAAYSYVKDVNDRSPLVRALGDHVQPLLERATPMVVSVVDCLDERIDATTGLIVDESTEIMNGFVTKKDQMKSAVQSTIDNTKSSVSARADAVVKVSQDVVTEFRRRRDSLFVEIVRRKDSLMEEVHNLQNRSEIQAVLQLPSKSVAFVKTTVNRQIDAATQQVRVVSTQLYAYRDQIFVVVQHFTGNDPRALQLREIAARQYESMCLLWTSGRTRMEMVWANILSNETVIQLHQQLMTILSQARNSFKNGAVLTQEKTEALVSSIVSTGQELLSKIPEGKRQTAVELYIQLCSKIRSSVGDEKVDAMSNFVLESAVAAWLRKASLAASA